MHNLGRILFPVIISLMLLGCSADGGTASDNIAEGSSLVRHAKFLNLVDHGDGTMSAVVTNPWDTSQIIARYYLVDTTKRIIPYEVPQGFQLVETPVKSALVYSSVHALPLKEMGVEEIIKGVADSRYFHSQFIKKGVEKGDIIDVGNAVMPSLEKIMKLSPDIALVSPYQNSGHGNLENSGVTIITMADYMEPSPIGRAEWILFLGALTGKLQEAKTIFESVKTGYNDIKHKISGTNIKPKILMETPYGSVWFVPGSESYQAGLIADAGGRNIVEGDSERGSMQMDVANVYNVALDADIWLMRPDKDLTLRDLYSGMPLAKDIKAFKDGNVWMANTNTTHIFDYMAFHPETVLRDYAIIFNPELFPDSELNFFKKLRKE